MEISAIFALLNPDNTLSVNRVLARNIGLNEAIIYGALIAKFQYYSANGMLDEEGWFYSTSEDLEESTTLKRRPQDSSIKHLKELGLIDTRLKGIPAKRYFFINPDAENLCKHLSQQDCTKCTTKVSENEETSLYKKDKLDSTKEPNKMVQKGQENLRYKTKDNKPNIESKEEGTKKEPAPQQASSSKKDFNILIDEYTTNPELKQAIWDYIAMRINKKAKPTNRALELVFKDLDKFAKSDAEKIAILEKSIKNNWTGVFELKQDEKKQIPRKPKEKSDGEFDMMDFLKQHLED